jgi:hypothetical protein
LPEYESLLFSFLENHPQSSFEPWRLSLARKFSASPRRREAAEPDPKIISRLLIIQRFSILSHNTTTMNGALFNPSGGGGGNAADEQTMAAVRSVRVLPNFFPSKHFASTSIPNHIAAFKLSCDGAGKQ